MLKTVLLEISTDMANTEVAQWIKKAIEKHNEADPAHRKVELTQNPHVQKVSDEPE